MSSTAPSIPVEKIRLGIKLFLAFSLVGFIIVIRRSSLGDTWTHLLEFDPRFLGLALALTSMDIVLSGVRIFIFARKVYPPITFGACVRSCLVHVFLAGVTPSQTGGAAAQIYVLYAEGMTVLDSTVVCFLGGFISTVIILLVGASLLLFHENLVPPGLETLSIIAFAIYVLILVMVLLSLTHPGAFKRAVRWLLTHLPLARRALNRHHLVERAFATVDRYHDLMTTFLLRGKMIFIAGVLITGLIYLNKFLIGWVVLRGLGVEVEMGKVLFLQIIPLLVFYFSPTPGSAGLAEVSTMAVMSSVVPRSYQAIYVLLWRFFTMIINMMLGAGVVVSYLSDKRGRRRGTRAASA
jgi:glycosyltransferase 2 family protein